MNYVFETYGRWDVEIVSGKGTKVIDSNGKEYVDFTSGIGVCNLGHCPENVVSELKEQLTTLWHTSNLFKSSLQDEVAKQLVTHSNGQAVFFCNSGAEANEAAIKLARKYTGKTKIISFLQSFHGRTMGTMAATGQEKIKAGFGNMLETFDHIAFNDIDALKAAIDNNTAAVMLEIVQGEGGVHPAEESFLLAVQQLCDEYGALLIVDEVQTGIGRTGKPFAYQHFSISPDIITSAKGLGSGFPVGAIIGKEKLKEAFNPGSHGSTFGGNPLAMTAANATLETVFENDFLTQVEEKAAYLIEKLTELQPKVDGFKKIRHKGLMVGLEFSDDTTSMITELRLNGLLVLNAGPNVIRMLPPLTVTMEEIDEALHIMTNTLLK